ncbi:signal transduction histidine kinase [Nocardioides marinisabuli]|uniref:Signal transduction histidine kinase n=1 Tax=Nocardioides marinisabuli TaxID=419476 RepID=A0A7Y9F1D1_9ACTN|nr:GAF domain-containing protein [Nocardioides marinisabuli]NYD57822.1 signal transduction histidine kinase [Nocardioides marinisabuli]
MTQQRRHPELAGSAQALLDAVVAISSDLDLPSVLSRIVESARELTGARFGALGVVSPDGGLSEFITSGLDPHEREQIGAPPRGRGILGLLIEHPEPLRMPDLGEHPSSYGFPPNHPPMRSFLGVPVRIRGTVFGNLYLTEKEGAAQFSDADTVLVEALASAAGFVIDNARAYGLSERRRQWLQAAAELSDALQPPVPREDALERIAWSACAMARADAAAIVSLSRPPREAAQNAVVAGPDRGHGSAGGEVRELVARALETLAHGSEAEEGDVGSRRVLVVPLRAHLAERTALVLLFEGVGPLEVEERELMISFADQAALALDRAQALDERAELAVISDRERIARDLHDVVIQRLFATGLQLQGAQMLADPDLATRLDKAVADLDLTIRDIRGSIFELQHRERSSLRSEVRTLVREYVPALGFSPVVRTAGPLDTGVPGSVREQLVPVLREALSNLSRHALADHAEVDLTLGESALVLRVDDDGVGLPAQVVESGMRNARRRAEALGGSCEISRREPTGTSFVWSVPVG